MKMLGNIYVLIVVLGVLGWVQNLYKLTQCDFEPSYKAEVIRTIGLVPFVGAFTGWIDFGK